MKRIFTALLALSLLTACDPPWQTVPDSEVAPQVEPPAALPIVTDITPTVVPSDTPTPEPQTATINAYIAYPSEGWCPTFRIFAVDQSGRLGGFTTTDGTNCGFSLVVPAPGGYMVFAWLDPNDPFAANLGQPGYPTSISAMYVGGDLQACLTPVYILVGAGDNTAIAGLPLAVYLFPCQYVPSSAPYEKG